MGLKDLNQRTATAATARKKLREAMLPKDELEDLLDAVPQSLDSLVSELFPSAKYVDTSRSASTYGYRSLIDDRPVNKKQHQTICKTLLIRLKQILAWFEKHNLPPKPLIAAAKKTVIERFGIDHCESKFSPLFPLEILDDLASGRTVADLLPDVVKSNVKTLLTGVTELMTPAMVASGIEAREVVSLPKSKGDDRKSVNNKASAIDEPVVEWSGFFPPGLWYKRFDMSPQLWRKALRKHWIPAGLAERDPLTPERGKVHFAKSLLEERGVTEPS